MCMTACKFFADGSSTSLLNIFAVLLLPCEGLAAAGYPICGLELMLLYAD